MNIYIYIYIGQGLGQRRNNSDYYGDINHNKNNNDKYDDNGDNDNENLNVQNKVKRPSSANAYTKKRNDVFTDREDDYIKSPLKIDIKNSSLKHYLSSHNKNIVDNAMKLNEYNNDDDYDDEQRKREKILYLRETKKSEKEFLRNENILENNLKKLRNRKI
jgi:hypothetical protein